MAYNSAHTGPEIDAAVSAVKAKESVWDNKAGLEVGATAPEDTGVLWIDTTAGTGGLKYFNGSSWVHAPVAYT